MSEIVRLNSNSKESAASPRILARSPRAPIRDVVESRWTTSNVYCIGYRGEAWETLDEVTVLDKDRYRTVEESIAALNSGAIANVDGYCLVAAPDGNYHLLWPAEKKTMEVFDFTAEVRSGAKHRQKAALERESELKSPRTNGRHIYADSFTTMSGHDTPGAMSRNAEPMEFLMPSNIGATESKDLQYGATNGQDKHFAANGTGDHVNGNHSRKAKYEEDDESIWDSFVSFIGCVDRDRSDPFDGVAERPVEYHDASRNRDLLEKEKIAARSPRRQSASSAGDKAAALRPRRQFAPSAASDIPPLESLPNAAPSNALPRTPRDSAQDPSKASSPQPPLVVRTTEDSKHRSNILTQTSKGKVRVPYVPPPQTRGSFGNANASSRLTLRSVGDSAYSGSHSVPGSGQHSFDGRVVGRPRFSSANVTPTSSCRFAQGGNGIGTPTSARSFANSTARQVGQVTSPDGHMLLATKARSLSPGFLQLDDAGSQGSRSPCFAPADVHRFPSQPSRCSSGLSTPTGTSRAKVMVASPTVRVGATSSSGSLTPIAFDRCIATPEVAMLTAQNMTVEDIWIDTEEFDIGSHDLRTTIVTKLGFRGSGELVPHRNSSGDVVPGVFHLSVTGSQGLILKLVSSRRDQLGRPTDAEKYVKIQSQYPEIVKELAFAFPVKILQLRGPVGERLQDLVITRCAPGVDLKTVIARKVQAGRAQSLKLILEAFAGFLRTVHKVYNSMNVGNLCLEHVFFEEESGNFTLIDIADLGAAVDDVEFFSSSLKSVAPLFGNDVIDAAVRHFQRGYNPQNQGVQ